MGKILYLIRVWSPGSRFQHWELFNRKKSWTNQKKKKKTSWRSKLSSSCISSIRSPQIKSFPISLFPATPPNTHSQHYPLPRSAPILLVSLDMLPSPLPTLFSAPLHFGHSYIYGVIRCGSPSGASRISAHTELWRAEVGGHDCRQESGKWWG